METWFWVVPVLTFLLGCVITAFGYTLGFTQKFSRLETTVSQLVKAMEKPVVLPEDIASRITKACTQVENLEKRVEKLENLENQHRD